VTIFILQEMVNIKEGFLMYRKFATLAGVLILVLLLPSLALAADTGKIMGTVTDARTGDPLPGANVILTGTTMGAATDRGGMYIILNVPPRSYNMEVSVVGYKVARVENVIVHMDLTVTMDVQLEETVLEGEMIVVTAARPLVERDVTNTSRILRLEDFQNLPIRSYSEVVATQPGVVMVGDMLHVRGGRQDEIAYYVDGVYVNDLRTGERMGEVPINSVEEISYQAGGFNAEYGFGNSGVVNTSTKTGRPTYNINGEVITDSWLSREEENLGAYSYGYNVYNMGLSGPVPGVGDKLRFFFTGERRYLEDRRPSLGEHPVLVDIGDSAGVAEITTEKGPLPHNSESVWMGNGNLLFDLRPVQIKIGGNYWTSDFKEYSQHRSLMEESMKHWFTDEEFSYSGYGKITHAVNPNTYYTATFSYHAHGDERGDGVLGRNIPDYGDLSDWNENDLTVPFLVMDGTNPGDPYRFGSGIFDSISVADDYYLNRSESMGAKLDITSQVKDVHELKAGFEYRYNTLRRYSVTRPMQIAGTLGDNPPEDETEVRAAYRAGYTDNFGYPIYFGEWGRGPVDPDKTLDSGPDGAKHPLIASAYIQDKIEISDLVLNVGLRWDMLDANDKKLKDPYNVTQALDVDGFIVPDSLEDTEVQNNFSPRIGIGFPITDRTVFHAQYGKFIQQPQLAFLYTGWDFLAGQILQGNQVDIGNPDLKPTKTTQYEIGLSQQVGENASLDVSAFYKEIRDLVILRNRYLADPNTYPQYQNGDYGSVKGLSVNFDLRRVDRVSAHASYTLQFAGGTGSQAGSDWFITWISRAGGYYPTHIAPLDFDQRHTGSLNLDFRTKPGDGPVLWGGHPFGKMGLNLNWHFGSGMPYTPKRIADTIFQADFSTAFPVGAVNSAYTDWTHQLDMKLDKSFAVAGVDFDVYVWVVNLLGTENPFTRKYNRGPDYGQQIWDTDYLGIFESTGLADDNGWLSTAEGQTWVENNGGAPAEAQYRAYINHPYNWGTPRQIRVGMRFDFNP
jgi:outer membrane receptor protein involved in Fe transport